MCRGNCFVNAVHHVVRATKPMSGYEPHAALCGGFTGLTVRARHSGLREHAFDLAGRFRIAPHRNRVADIPERAIQNPWQ
jgi:hypothetical protein